MIAPAFAHQLIAQYVPATEQQSAEALVAAYDGLPPLVQTLLWIAAALAVCFGVAMTHPNLRIEWRYRQQRRALEFLLYGPREKLERDAALPQLRGLLWPLVVACRDYDGGKLRSMWDNYTKGADNLIKLRVLMPGMPDGLFTNLAIGILNDDAGRKAWRRREALFAWLTRIHPRLGALGRKII